MPLKNTPFTDIHISLGAKMQEFAGFYMPVEYSGIIDEHLTVCKTAGVFDVSHMGEFYVKGENAFSYLQKLTCNDLSVLPVGKAQYTCFMNEAGGIVDDLIIYRMEKNEYMLVVNASNIEKDWKYCTAHNTEGVLLENISGKVAQLAIQGPKALEILQSLSSANLSAIPYYSFITGDIAGEKNVIISNTGYTGAGGFEIYFSPSAAENIWNAIFDAGKTFDIKSVGLGARDTLRLEMGYCLYGNELNENITPLEAGLGWITKFTEENNFIGRSMLQIQRSGEINNQLIAFELQEKGIPRKGYPITNEKNEMIGEVTSGTLSPVTKKGIGLGYIQKNKMENDLSFFIRIRQKLLKAEITKLPFRKTRTNNAND